MKNNSGLWEFVNSTKEKRFEAYAKAIEKKTCINVSAELLEATFEIYQHLFCLVRWQLSTANTVTPVLVRTAKFFCCCSLWLFNEVCSGNYDGIHYSQNNHRQ